MTAVNIKRKGTRIAAVLAAVLLLAAAACGADGLMIEVHNDPTRALCDGAQSLTPEQFSDVMRRVTKIRDVVTTI